MENKKEVNLYLFEWIWSLKYDKNKDSVDDRVNKTLKRLMYGED